MPAVAITRDEDNNGRHGTRAACHLSLASSLAPLARGGASFRSVCGRLPSAQPFASRSTARRRRRAAILPPIGTPADRRERYPAGRCAHGASFLPSSLSLRPFSLPAGLRRLPVDLSQRERIDRAFAGAKRRLRNPRMEKTDLSLPSRRSLMYIARSVESAPFDYTFCTRGHSLLSLARREYMTISFR